MCFPLICIQHLGIDARVVATGIMEGIGLESLSDTISTLDAAKHFGSTRFAIIVLQTMIADGFMVRAHSSP